jgi:hypothetical protein
MPLHGLGRQGPSSQRAQYLQLKREGESPRYNRRSGQSTYGSSIFVRFAYAG